MSLDFPYLPMQFQVQGENNGGAHAAFNVKVVEINFYWFKEIVLCKTMFTLKKTIFIFLFSLYLKEKIS